jgi:hypothetical protein
MDEFQLDFRPTFGYSESYNTPNVLIPPSRVDALGIAVHKLIQRTRLKDVHLQACILPELFWPPDDVRGSPFWPNLETLVVHSVQHTPEGHWYFMEDPAIASHAEFVGEEDADVDPDGLRAEDADYDTANTFRTLPDPERLNPLLIAVARAIQHAPVLRHVSLCLDDTNRKLNPKYLANHEELDLRRSFTLFYLAAGVPDCYGADEALFGKARVVWEVGDWRPDEEVQRAWRDAVGPDGLLIFEDVAKIPPPGKGYSKPDEDSDEDSDVEDADEDSDEDSDEGSGEGSDTDSDAS